jgi:hypothetical protein
MDVVHGLAPYRRGYALSLIGVASIGLFVLPLPVLATVLLVRGTRHLRRRERSRLSDVLNCHESGFAISRCGLTLMEQRW